MGFISRLKRVTGKTAQAQEASIKARDAISQEEADAILDSELAENPAVRKAKAKVEALRAQQAEAEKKGEGSSDGA